MTSTEDNKTALGKLGRQEILTFLMIAVFGGFIVIVFIVMYLVLSNPEIVQTIVIRGSVDVGTFVERFDEVLVAFLVLLGVGVGVKTTKR
jgi:hypothetical protein